MSLININDITKRMFKIVNVKLMGSAVNFE